MDQSRTPEDIQREIKRLLTEAAGVPVGAQHSLLLSRASALAQQARDLERARAVSVDDAGDVPESSSQDR